MEPSNRKRSSSSSGPKTRGNKRTRPTTAAATNLPTTTMDKTSASYDNVKQEELEAALKLRERLRERTAALRAGLDGLSLSGSGSGSGSGSDTTGEPSGSSNRSDNGNEEENEAILRERIREEAAALRARLLAGMSLSGSRSGSGSGSGSGTGSDSPQSGFLKKILEGLTADGEEGKQIQALNQLCEVLSIGTEDSLRTFSLDAFVPVLVGLLGKESNADIMLLTARAVTHLLDALPGACTHVVRHGAVPRFVARLVSIEYMDLAEQSLQALKKISVEQPRICLRAGAMMAVLSYLDFFSTGVQRVALSTAANMCRRITPAEADYVMEAVPILTNLLQYQDAEVLELASVCLTRIAVGLSSSPDKLDELCNNHGLVTQVASLVSGHSHHASSTLIKLLSVCAGGSHLAAKTLLLMGISGNLKDILSSSVNVVQIYETISLANELLPPMNLQEVSPREEFLLEQPQFLQQFAMDLLPVLVQTYGSSANVVVRTKCLSVIGKLMHFSSADMIQTLSNVTNLSSFLAGVLACNKEPQLLLPALQTAETLMEKLPETFLRMFIREGVVHAIDVLISQQKPSEEDENRAKVNESAKAFKEKHFSLNSQTSYSNDLLRLKDMSSKLKAKSKSLFRPSDLSADKELKLAGMVADIVSEVEKVSTFEFTGSGVVRGLLRYFTCGYYSKGKVSDSDMPKLRQHVLMRYKSFVSVVVQMNVLVQKLQSALSSLECFTVVPVKVKPSKGDSSDADQVSLSDSILLGELPCDLGKKNPTYDILALLRVLEALNQLAPRLRVQTVIDDFSEGKIASLDGIGGRGNIVPSEEFVNSKITSKLAKLIKDALGLQSVTTLPTWCSQVTKSCPFLFPFETRRQYFYSTTFGLARALTRVRNGPLSEREARHARLPKFKVRVARSTILESAVKVMEMIPNQNLVLEIEFFGEVGTGLGPTLEFYTLLSHEMQKSKLGLWISSTSSEESSENIEAHLGLFPRPWSPSVDASKDSRFSKVLEYFQLLGRVMARALQDGRLMDLPLSPAFYKLVLGHDLDVVDIISFDTAFGTTLQELEALVLRNRHLETGDNDVECPNLLFRGTAIQDLGLDFTLPGHPEYVLKPGGENVDMNNLAEYISLVIDATVRSGISRQMDAFRSGFNQVFDISSLQIFSPDELDLMLCGRRELWQAETLVDHIKFDHGYSCTSRVIMDVLAVMAEFNPEQQRSFCRFVTGAPRLPPGGLAALNPKLTIVRKQSNGANSADEDLPSVMTCANYLKLPAYSTKEIMLKKLLYAINEGQGSFDLS